MSRFNNNKHYSNASDYHAIIINGKRRTVIENNVIINVARDENLAAETHLKSIVISNTVKDGKLVEHAVAREGSFNHYKKNINSTYNIKVNGAPINRPNVFSIMTSWYKRDIFSSKIATVSEGGGETTVTFTQTWIG